MGFKVFEKENIFFVDFDSGLLQNWKQKYC